QQRDRGVTWHQTAPVDEQVGGLRDPVAEGGDRQLGTFPGGVVVVREQRPCGVVGERCGEEPSRGVVRALRHAVSLPEEYAAPEPGRGGGRRLAVRWDTPAEI